MEEIIEK